MTNPKKYSNHLGIIGWIAGGRWGFERYLYTMHRITGVGILFYFVIHIFVTGTRALGRSSWEAWMDHFNQPLFLAGEFLVFAAFAFHALNGIRLILIELGYAVGKAEEPVYPYRTSLNKQRHLAIIVLILAAVMIIMGAYDFIILDH